jgi:hypothetical protein
LNDRTIALTERRDPRYVFGGDPDVLVVVSSQYTRFAAVYQWEQALLDTVLRGGYVRVATYSLLPDYFLWVLAKPDSPARRMI